jgi:hypothetical protein
VATDALESTMRIRQHFYVIMRQPIDVKENGQPCRCDMREAQKQSDKKLAPDFGRCKGPHTSYFL